MKRGYLPKAITLILSIVLFSSCQRALYYYFGVRNPKIESKESITRLCDRFGMTNDNVYCYKDSATFFKYLIAKKVKTPEMVFYNSNGDLMLYKDEKKCVAQTDSLIDFLNLDKVIKTDASNNLYKYLPDLCSLDGKPLDIKEFKGYDYYLVINMAKWNGKVCANHILPWEQEIKQRKDLKLKVIKVTCDYMNFWHVDKKYLFKVYGRKTKFNKRKKATNKA